MFRLAKLNANIAKVRESRLAGDAAIYLFSTLVNMGLPFLLLPVFTRLLTPSELGPVVVVQGALSFFSAILALGLRPAILRAFVAEKGSEALATFGSAVVLAFIVTAVLSLFAGMVVILDFHPLALPSQWLIYIILAAGIGAPLQYYLSALQAQHRARRFGVVQNSATVISAILSIAFLLAYDGDWTARAVGVLLGPALAGIIVLFLANREQLLGKPTHNTLRENMALAWATLPHTAVNSFLGFADRLFVAHYATAAVLGLYGVASQLCLVPFAIGLALNNALQPWWMAKLNEMQSVSDWRKIRNTAIFISGAVIFACLLYLVVLYLLTGIILPEVYFLAWQFVPVLFISSLLNVVYFQFVAPLFFYKRTSILSRIGYANMAFTLVAMFGFAEWLGAIGVAIALAASRAFLLVCTVASVNRLVHKEISLEGR